MENSEKFKGWRVLYRNAVLESDPAKLILRIREAHQSIQERTRQLWYEGSTDTGERHALTAASHYLQILRTLGGTGGAREKISA